MKHLIFLLLLIPSMAFGVIEWNAVEFRNDTAFDLAQTLTELAGTPSTPASGKKKIYAKTDGKVYTLDDTGTETEIGAGGGGTVSSFSNTDSVIFLDNGGGDWEAEVLFNTDPVGTNLVLNPTVLGGISLSIPRADSGTDGYLYATDWTTFNNKLSPGNFGISSNTLSSTNTNGDMIFDPNGTGKVKFNDLTASTVPYLDSTKGLISSSVTPTELGYLSGVTSAIQTQLNAKQATGNYITALTGDVTASGPGSSTASIASNVIVNADVNSSAAIDFSKLASLSTGQVVAGNGGVPTAVTMSGGATIGNTGVVTLGNTAVTGQPITGFTSGSGTVSATDTILEAIEKLDGNVAAVSAGAVTAFSAVQNIGISVSVASNNLTITLTGANGSALSGSNIGTIPFRDNSNTSGGYNNVNVTSPVSLTVVNDASLGCITALSNCYIFIFAMNNSGTVELAVNSAWVGGDGLMTTTVLNTSSDSTGNYSSSARTNLPSKMIGRILYFTSPVGVYSATPDSINLGSPSEMSRGFDTPSSCVSGVSFPTSGQHGDLTSVCVAPGKYIPCVSFAAIHNGNTWSELTYGMSTVSGNNLGSQVIGRTMMKPRPFPTSTDEASGGFCGEPLTLTYAFCYHLKFRAVWTGGGFPTANGCITLNRKT